MKLATKITMLAALVFAVGCGPSYGEHRITHVRAAAGGEIPQSTLQVTLPEGAILSADLVPYDTDDDIMKDSDITSDDASILDVIHVSGDTRTTYAFVGRRAGTTSVHFYAKGKEVRTEPATVTAAE